MKNTSLQTLCRVAALVAIQIVLDRFCSFNTPLLRVGFGFVPLAVCGMLYGPVWAGVAGGLADVLGTFLSPYGFYPPITITAILLGVVFGLFLHRPNLRFFPHILGCTLVCCVGLSLFLQSYWLSLLNEAPYSAMLLARLPQCGFNIAVYLVLLPLLRKLTQRVLTAARAS
ncbi:MAG: folate family ECF transporter S component [Oscillospiraceae bacterium]